MTAAPEQISLGADFPPADAGRWHELVAAVLRKSGRIGEDDDPAKAVDILSHTTYDGVKVKPLYTLDDTPDSSTGLPGARPFVRGGRAEGVVRGGWDIRAHHADPDVAATAKAALTDLENGATSLWLTLGADAIPVASLGDVLADVLLNLAPVTLDAGVETAAAADAYLALVAARGLDPATVRGSLGADPVGLLARTGTDPIGLENAAALAARCAGTHPGLRALTVDATAHHDAGGSDAQELGAAIATGLAYLRAMTAAGMTVPQALSQVEFRLAATADQFATIAKFRAARRLWSRVADVCGAPEAGGMHQHAVTSAAMQTRRDPWVNMLRATVACFGAGVGGADAVTVRPFDATLGLPDDLSRRIARNTSSLLLLESHVGQVVDPAGGSWYVEKLTDGIAEAAWAWFTEIERAGGIVAALGSGLVAERLDATWTARSRNLARRKDPVTGVSEFPNLEEVLPERTPAPAGTPAGEGALPVHRYAEAYEELRDAADAAAERPAVFMATVGPLAVHTARLGYASNLFHAGGLATPDGGALTDPEAIAAAFKASGATLACICSSDKVYAESAAPVAAALKGAGAKHVWLAGKPGDRKESDAAAGVDGYIHIGCDVLATLREAHRIAEVAR